MGSATNLDNQGVTASGNFSFALGNRVTATGNNGCFAQGSAATANSDNGSFAQGLNATASGYGCLAQGYAATATGGSGSFASGAYAKATGSQGCFAQGRNTTATGNNGSFAQGYNALASASNGCFAHGSAASATAAGAVQFGAGTNSQADTLRVGSGPRLGNTALTAGAALTTDANGIITESDVSVSTGAGVAPLNLPILTSDPSSPDVGDVWLLLSAGTLSLKVREDGSTTTTLASA